MKAKEVINILNISRPTLCNYVKNGKITATLQSNGHYEYDSNSVYKLAAHNERISVIYSRVSTYKQKSQLNTQIKKITNYTTDNNVSIKKIYQDISTGMNLYRKEFNNLLTDVLNYKINFVYITNKDRLTRTSFKTLEQLFLKFGTKICVINDNFNKSEEEELLEDIISILHTFSMKTYSSRRKDKFKLIQKDLILEKQID